MNFPLGLLILIPLISFAEDPPEPEYPYPKNVSKKIQVEQPKNIDEKGGYYYDTKSQKKEVIVIPGVEKAYKVGDDGSYYYETETNKDPAKAYPGVEQPKDIDKEGGYYYTEKKKPTTYEVIKDVEKPVKVEEDGTFVYDRKIPQASNTLSVRAGLMSAPQFQPQTASGLDYSEVYSKGQQLALMVDYDWKLTGFAGGFNLKLGSGLSSASGMGQFADGINPGLQPRESFQFYVFPNTLSLTYKFKIWDNQILTPYVDGGAGYFTFVEMRSDGDSTRFGGAGVLTATGGLLISHTLFGPNVELQNEYGIAESWFDLQFKQVVGLDSRKDFTSYIITLGFAVGF